MGVPNSFWAVDSSVEVVSGVSRHCRPLRAVPTSCIWQVRSQQAESRVRHKMDIHSALSNRSHPCELLALVHGSIAQIDLQMRTSLLSKVIIRCFNPQLITAWHASIQHPCVGMREITTSNSSLAALSIVLQRHQNIQYAVSQKGQCNVVTRHNALQAVIRHASACYCMPSYDTLPTWNPSKNSTGMPNVPGLVMTQQAD